MESLGPKIRRQRRRLGLTLDELSGRTSISKPYLSMIENSRIFNPPSDEKLRCLEQTLGFSANELLTQAHLQRTPRDVRAVLGKLLTDGKEPAEAVAAPAQPVDTGILSGVLRELVKSNAGVEKVAGNAVPVINRMSAGYPRDFTDLGYPPRVADEYIGCPEISDSDAFAARVHGDSMTPKYDEGDIVIFSPALSPRNGDDCFVHFSDGQTTFKRVFFEMDTHAPMLRLQPRNEFYRPVLLSSDLVAGLYRAIFRYQRVDGD